MDNKGNNTNSTPTPAATVPEPRVQPAPTQPVPQGPVKKKGMSKGMLWGIIGGSIAFILLVVGIVLAVILLSGPSKEDYKEAHDKVTKVRGTYLRVGSAFRMVSYGTSTASTDKIKESVEEYKKSVDDLKDMKALRDKDVKQKYDDFIKQNNEFTTMVGDLADASDELLETTKNCRAATTFPRFSSDRSKLLENYDKTVSSCVSAVKKLAKVKSQLLSEEAKKLADAFDEQRGIVEEMQKAHDAGDASGLSAAASKLYRQLTKFKAGDAPKKLNEAFQKAEVNSQLNALGRILTEKANQS